MNEGRLRDIISKMLNVSKTKVAQIDSINNNLIPELKKELEEGRLKFSVANELSGLEKDKQQEALEKYNENGNITVKEARQMKEEPEAAVVEGEFEPDPEKIHSICYTCQHWSECDQKNSNVTSCNEYINKAEMEKTKEQQYEEEQKEIDKQTQRALKERADEEKMKQLPSERTKEKKRYTKRMGASEYEDLVSGKKKFYILKDEGQQEKEEIELLEFKDGKATGRTLLFEIEYVQKEYSGITEGYCVLGIRKEDYSE